MNQYNAYAKTEMSAMDQSSMEARALIKSAAALNEIKQNWGDKQDQLPAALDKNRLLWTVIAGEIREENNPQPLAIKNNILNLALFIFQRTISTLAEPTPEKLDILININMNIAKGLTENSVQNGATAAQATEQQSQPQAGVSVFGEKEEPKDRVAPSDEVAPEDDEPIENPFE